MSLHVSPPFEGHAGAADLASSLLLAAAPLQPVRPAAGEGALSVHLGAMGLTLALGSGGGAADGAVVLDLTGDDVDGETFRFMFAVPPERPPAAVPSRVAVSQDMLIQRLSSALAAAETSADPFSGLYADALRLAVVTRFVSLYARPARMPADEARPDPAPQPRRVRSGLPKWRLKRVVAFVDEHLSETITLADMAAAAGLSRMHFAAQFRVATGQRPHEYLLRRRIDRAKELLAETCEPLVQIALGVGFQTQAHFTTVFRRFVGDTPYQWRCANAVRA